MGRASNRKKGRHKWIAMVGYALTEHEAEAVWRGQEIVTLGAHNVVWKHVGCFTCEQPIEQAWGTPCPGRPVMELQPGGIKTRPELN